MKKIVSLVVLLTSLNSFAMVVKTIELGLRNNHSIADNVTSKDQMKFYGGAIVSFFGSGGIGFRTGLLYVMKDAAVDSGGVTVTVERSFIDIPVTIIFGSPRFEAYAGANASIKSSSKCKVGSVSCTLADEKSTVFQPVVGFNVGVSQMVKVGAFYEFETEYSKDWKMSAYGLGVGFNF